MFVFAFVSIVTP